MILAKEKLDYQPQQQPESQLQPVKEKKLSRGQRVQQKLLLTFMVLCCFVMGTLVAYYYAQVAYVGVQIDALQKKVAELRLEGYGLEQEITQIVALEQIEKIATTELGMIKPVDENVVLVSNSNAVANSDIKTENPVTEPDKQVETITLPESDKVDVQPKNRLIQAFADMMERWNS
ncbi:septum formation initiator family protein [Peptococcaceae bacterium 1198_IL3148]